MATIRRALPHEAPSLTSLALRSKAHWGYDEDFMRRCHAELTVTAREVEQDPLYVAERDRGLLGFYGLSGLSQGEAELEYLFVEPAHMGQGLGRALLEHAARLARGLGFSTLVIQGDPNAQRFYEALGARQVGDRASESIAGRRLPLFHLPLKADVNRP